MKGSESMGVIDYIKEGRENAITRRELQQLTGYPDRVIRKEIQKAKGLGMVIINDGTGYYKPCIGEVEYLRMYIRSEEHKAKSILKGLKNYRAVLEDIEYGRMVDDE